MGFWYQLSVFGISIHAPARGATGQNTIGFNNFYIISIHAPARGATQVTLILPLEAKISIHAPARGATGVITQMEDKDFHFNPRTREGCDALAWPWRIRRRLFQSTHPRGVRPDILKDLRTWRTISIHAPARGATSSLGFNCFSKTLFQSTHPRGVRQKNLSFPAPLFLFQSTHPRGVRRLLRLFSRRERNHFNPRTREGCDNFVELFDGGERVISIHAPARGATCLNHRKYLCSEDFNPRTREGCDLRPTILIKERSGFQSTHPRGVRQIGEDYVTLIVDISIHAPARGATPVCGIGHSGTPYFNPRTREGCDNVLLCIYVNDRYFNPRTREGCDH